MWKNCIIESNGTVGGTFQSSFRKLDLCVRRGYWDAAPGVPALKVNDCAISVDLGLLNGTGGIEFTANACKFSANMLSTPEITDAFVNFSAVRLNLEHCTLQTGVTNTSFDVRVFNTSFAGVTTRSLHRTLPIGTTDTWAPSTLRHFRAFQRTVRVSSLGRSQADVALAQAGVRNEGPNRMVGMAAVGTIAGLVPIAVLGYLKDKHGDALNNGVFGAPLAQLSTVTADFGLCLRDAFQFEFGSSRGSKDKDDQNAAVVAALVKTTR